MKTKKGMRECLLTKEINRKEMNDWYKLNNKEKRKIYIFKRRHV